MEGAGMRPLFIYIIRCDPAKPMRKKGKTKFSKENKWPKNEKIQGNNCFEIRFLLEKRQKYPCFSLEKRQKLPNFVLKKRKCYA